MDTKEYFKRIRYDGPINTEASTLTALCRRHLETVPFDTFDIFGGEPKRLSLEKVYNDVVVRQRGGFCYELNGLFTWLLREIGFKVDMLQAQVFVEAKNIFNPKYDHQCLLVTTNDGDKWLADVGFGNNTFVTPLKLELMKEQTQESGAFRISKENDEYFVEKKWKVVIGGKEKRNERAKSRGWHVIYKFTTTPCHWSEFEEMCKFQQEDEDGFLSNNTLGGLQTPSGNITTWGYAVCEKKYIDPYTEEIKSVVNAKDEEEFKQIIKDKLGIVLDFHLKVKYRDYTGFADEQGCCSCKKPDQET